MKEKNIIYLDNAATTYMRKQTVLAMEPYFTTKYGNPSSAHEFGMEADRVMNYGRQTLADILNAESEEIYFTSGGTESDNWALYGCAYANKKKGRHIITSVLEHPAVLSTCKWLEQLGFEVTYLGVNTDGVISLEELEHAIRKDTILISIMTANNEIGTIQPIEEIGRIAKKHGVLFHTDAVQAFCHIPIDVKRAHIDLLSVSSHKFGGPKGMGFLYIRKGVEITPFMHGGHQENGMRAGTGNVPGVVGMTKAAEYAALHMKECMKRETMLRSYLFRRIINEIPFVKLNGSWENRLPGNLNLCFAYVDGGTLLEMLDMKGICVSTGSACASGEAGPSGVLKAIGLSDELAYSAIRMTLSSENTREDMDRTADVLKETVWELRCKSAAFMQKIGRKI